MPSTHSGTAICSGTSRILSEVEHVETPHQCSLLKKHFVNSKIIRNFATAYKREVSGKKSIAILSLLEILQNSIQEDGAFMLSLDVYAFEMKHTHRREICSI